VEHTKVQVVSNLAEAIDAWSTINERFKARPDLQLLKRKEMVRNLRHEYVNTYSWQL